MMKIAVLGSRGMLGHALMKVFGGEVRGFDLPELDITNRENVFRVLGDFFGDEPSRRELREIHVVINAAGYTAVDDAEKNVDLCMNVNGEAVGILADFCKKNGAVFVHYSTDYVFDGHHPQDGFLGYEENSSPAPLNIYGQSKALGEQLLFESALREFYLIRSSWLFGPDGKNFVDTMLRIAMTMPPQPLRVVNDQIGKPTYTLDLARATRMLLEGTRDELRERDLKDDSPFGIYHLVNEGAVTWYDFAKEIFEESKNIHGRRDFEHIAVEPISSQEFARPAQRPAVSTLQNTRAPLLRHHRVALKEYLRTLQR